MSLSETGRQGCVITQEGGGNPDMKEVGGNSSAKVNILQMKMNTAPGCDFWVPLMTGELHLGSHARDKDALCSRAGSLRCFRRVAVIAGSLDSESLGSHKSQGSPLFPSVSLKP